MIWQTNSTGSEDTERLGELLGRRLRGGEVLELRSDLGGGKTTFVRGLVRGAGCHDRVSSPTFTLSRVYKSKDFEIHHFDFYRLQDPGLVANELAEVVGDGQHFQALVVSPAFDGKSRIQRHQMVYAALGDRMREEIHALSMRTLTPAEWQAQGSP